jgi:HSF-type DNA-binding
MLILSHVEKERRSWLEAHPFSDDEPPVPSIEWCTNKSGGGSDHVVVLYNLERLVKELLPLFGFAPISEASFVRKLCRWGFHQVSTTYRAVQKHHSNRPLTSQMYECQHFRAGNYALLSHMWSDTAEKRRHRTGTDLGGDAADAAVDQHHPEGHSRLSTGGKRSRDTFERASTSLETPRDASRLEDRITFQGEPTARTAIPYSQPIQHQTQLIQQQYLSFPSAWSLHLGSTTELSQQLRVALPATSPLIQPPTPSAAFYQRDTDQLSRISSHPAVHDAQSRISSSFGQFGRNSRVSEALIVNWAQLLVEQELRARLQATLPHQRSLEEMIQLIQRPHQNPREDNNST